jgi:hypothetical protein
MSIVTQGQQRPAQDPSPAAVARLDMSIVTQGQQRPAQDPSPAAVARLDMSIVTQGQQRPAQDPGRGEPPSSYGSPWLQLAE